MTLTTAFLSRLGNHDYYDLPAAARLLSGITARLQWLVALF